MSRSLNIETLRATNDTARIYKWDVEITGPGIGDGRIINLRCHTLTQPQPNYNPIDINIRGFTKKEYGAIEWNEITFNIYEIQSYDILLALWDWGQKQFQADTGVQMNKADCECTITMLLEDLQDAPVVQWKLIGAILSNPTPPDLGSDKAGIWDYSFTVQYDYALLI